MGSLLDLKLCSFKEAGTNHIAGYTTSKVKRLGNELRDCWRGSGPKARRDAYFASSCGDRPCQCSWLGAYMVLGRCKLEKTRSSGEGGYRNRSGRERTQEVIWKRINAFTFIVLFFLPHRNPVRGSNQVSSHQRWVSRSIKTQCNTKLQ